MISPVVTSALVGAGVGTAYYLGHIIVGDEEDFDDAGVQTAGITVSVAAAVATYIVLVLAGVV